ncbi:hypothetical protein [Brumicola pallidula]|uniref:Uncharacterized protein n=1 Tax=Brumicola pallidula DSM 14239 = ACAM 615 TaxID=1121922 RepID=K6Y6U6_9ALTE|nr:hypothetical protein [Glaciecola pallidula]GAC28514.1 hypothetical protein GPAL_1650 [Glaciecola pallidula DSM 14239 = ACAM 615]
MQVAPKFTNIDVDTMHQYLLGTPASEQHPRYIADLLQFPDLAWVTHVEIPQQAALYGLPEERLCL